VANEEGQVDLGKRQKKKRIHVLVEKKSNNLSKQQEKKTILVAVEEELRKLDKQQKKERARNGKSEKETTMVKPLFEIPPVRRVTRHMAKQAAPKIVGLAPMYPHRLQHMRTQSLLMVMMRIPFPFQQLFKVSKRPKPVEQYHPCIQNLQTLMTNK
jgi:hypothetical protein